MILNNIQNESSAVLVSQRILNCLQKQVHLDGHDIVVTPSIGIAMAPADSQDVESL